MTKYTIDNVAHIIDPHQTRTVVVGVEAYLNEGKIPAFDPCLSCEPNYIRQLIAKIQNAEAAGLWPPAEEPKEEVAEKAKPAQKERK